MMLYFSFFIIPLFKIAKGPLINIFVIEICREQFLFRHQSKILKGKIILYYIWRVMCKLEIEFLRPVPPKSGVRGMEPGITITL